MKNKIFIVSTTSTFFNFFKGQLKFLSLTYDITLLSKDTSNSLNTIANRENVNCKEVIIEREISLFKDFRALLLLSYLFIKNKPDMVWGNTPKGSFLSILAAYIARIRVRQYMCHGLRYQSESGIKKKILVLMEKITCQLATQVVCVSFGVREQLIKDKIASSKKAIVIGDGSCNGIDTEFFNSAVVDKKKLSELRNELGLTDNDFVFIFIGRVVRDKGIGELLSAFKELSKERDDIRLVVVGKIEKHNAISQENLDVLTNNKYIHYLGKQNDIRPFLAISDTLILPSYREGFGVVLLEALSMGLPIIASNIIGCSDIVEPNVNGLFCERGNIESLIQVMNKVILDEKFRYTLQVNARESILKKYSKSKVWDNYLEYYKSILGTNV